MTSPLAPHRADRYLLVGLTVVATAAGTQPPRRPAATALASPRGTPKGAALPPNWRMRLDRANLPADYRIAPEGGVLHVTTVRAAGIFFDPRLTAAGTYRAEATITQLKAPAHPEAYGLFVGGADLEGVRQAYVYFVVRGDGRYLVKRRAGSDVQTLVDWTRSAAVHEADASGRATNALRVDVARDSVRLFANGRRVTALAHDAALRTDGIVGLRINHALDVRVDGPKVTALR